MRNKILMGIYVILLLAGIGTRRWWGMIGFGLLALIGAIAVIYLWVHASVLIGVGVLMLICALLFPALYIRIRFSHTLELEGIVVMANAIGTALGLGALGMLLLLIGIIVKVVG